MSESVERLSWEQTCDYVKSCLGWMSPDGEIVPCQSFEHISKAEEIIRKLGIHTEKDPDVALYDIGWIHIQMSGFSNNRIYFWIKNTATERQALKIKEIIKTIPEWFDDAVISLLRQAGVLPHIYDENGCIIDYKVKWDWSEL